MYAGGATLRPRNATLAPTLPNWDMSCSISFDGVLPCTMRASEAAVSTAADVVSRLGADCAAGLTEDEVERRRKVFGRNEFTIKEEEPLWRKYLNQVR